MQYFDVGVMNMIVFKCFWYKVGFFCCDCMNL